MSIPIIQTKLFVPPVRPNHISRSQLLGKLDAGLRAGQKATLISAPAGYGKTTLTAEWGMRILQSTTPHSESRIPNLCWLSLDEYDDDPNRFWQYIVAALRTAVPVIGAATRQQLLSTPLPPAPALLTGLLNELADLPHPIILTLDDYHVIDNKSIHEGVSFLLDHAPPQLHLVFITRADPPFSLSRLRARGLLNEIRVADLRFNGEETAVFLRQVMGLFLSAEEITTLETRTEGWIAGLQLTAVSLQGRTDTSDFIKNFSGSHFYILEYLTEEVLQQQLEFMQTFLLQTSILSRLSGPLCDAVTGRNDSRAILARLHSQNLFITPLDDGRHWFRTHRLLADLLHNRLRQTASPAEVQALHLRASRWCEAHGVWETAINHAIQAEEWERAADLIAEAYQQLISQGRIATWQAWLAQIPAPFIQTRPALLVRQAWATFLNGEVKQAERMLIAARQSLIESDPSSEEKALRGELATYLATVAFFREEPAQIIAAAQEALVYLPPDALTSRARATIALGHGVSLAGDTRQAMRLYHESVDLARTAGNPFFLAHALEVVADGQFHTGQLRDAAATCREIIALGRKDRTAPLPFTGNGHTKLAGIYVEWRELAQAEEQMAAGVALNQQGGIGYNLLQDHITQVRLRQALGDTDGALAALRQAEAIFRQNQSKIMAVQMMVCAVQFWLDAADVVTAASWAEGHPSTGQPITPGELPIIGQEVQQVSLARVRLAQQRPDDVLAIYNQVHDQARTAGRIARVIEIGLLGALAYQVKRETAVALDVLHQVLALTEPEGYVQIFVESGEPCRRLLCQIPPTEQTGYVQKLLRAFPDPIQIASAALVEPLSPRELQVLRLIAAGLSNKQIATEMTVSLNTVKKHTTHIYGKLEVNGRTQAIARARELNLL
jgi:LuxR family maltose regulon positive regulatory protein